MTAKAVAGLTEEQVDDYERELYAIQGMYSPQMIRRKVRPIIHRIAAEGARRLAEVSKRLLLTHGCSWGDEEPMCADCRDVRRALATVEEGGKR